MSPRPEDTLQELLKHRGRLFDELRAIEKGRACGCTEFPYETLVAHQAESRLSRLPSSELKIMYVGTDFGRMESTALGLMMIDRLQHPDILVLDSEPENEILKLAQIVRETGIGDHEFTFGGDVPFPDLKPIAVMPIRHRLGLEKWPAPDPTDSSLQSERGEYDRKPPIPGPDGRPSKHRKNRKMRKASRRRNR